MNWFVYIVECNDRTLYTGITNNLEKRLQDHNRGKGARYTAQRSPVTLVWVELQINQSAARKREIEVKDWRREKKQALINGLHKEYLASLIR